MGQRAEHVIEKAIQKASGAGGESYESARYGGYGPGGCVVVIDCLTVNPTRTMSDVRNSFAKTGCKPSALPRESKQLGEDELALFEKFLGTFTDCDDVKEVYHNVSSP